MRHKRLLLDGATYHVISRTVAGEMLMGPEEMKELFQSVIRRAKEKYSFTVSDFTIMGNHFHFVIKPEGRDILPVIMQWILGVSAQAINKRLNRFGHFWFDRYKSWIVPNMRALQQLFEYIGNNPVRARIADRPEDWPFGGAYHRKIGDLSIISPCT